MAESSNNSATHKFHIDMSKMTSQADKDMVTIDVPIAASREPLGIHFISTAGTKSPRICSFETNSRAAGFLMLGDTITHVNGMPTNGAVKTENMIRSAVGANAGAAMTILRQKTVRAKLSKPTDTTPLGMTLAHSGTDGLWVSGVKTGGIAAKTFLIAPPCKVLAINGKPEACQSWRQAVDELSSRLEPELTLEYGGDFGLVTEKSDKRVYMQSPSAIGEPNAAATA